MSRVPKNVQQYLDTSNRLETATTYASSLNTGNVKAAWFQKDYQRSHNLATKVPTGRTDTVPELREVGVKTGIEAVKVARAARLKELYEAEALQFEAELNALGLSLVKPRD